MTRSISSPLTVLQQQRPSTVPSNTKDGTPPLTLGAYFSRSEAAVGGGGASLPYSRGSTRQSARGGSRSGRDQRPPSINGGGNGSGSPKRGPPMKVPHIVGSVEGGLYLSRSAVLVQLDGQPLGWVDAPATLGAPSSNEARNVERGPIEPTMAPPPSREGGYRPMSVPVNSRRSSVK